MNFFCNISAIKSASDMCIIQAIPSRQSYTHHEHPSIHLKSFIHCPCTHSPNQPISQPASQPKQSTNQSFNAPVIQMKNYFCNIFPLTHLPNQPISQSINQSINQSVNQPINHTTKQASNQSNPSFTGLTHFPTS